MATRPTGRKIYAEHGPDGQFDGRYLGRYAIGGDTHYRLHERGGELTEHAFVYADGSCVYNDEDCAPDDPRLLALIAQVAPVEVRPAARALHPPLAAYSSNRPMARPARFAPAGAGDRCGHRGAPHSARRRWWLRDTAMQQPHRKARRHSDAHTGFFAVLVSQEAASCIH